MMSPPPADRRRHNNRRGVERGALLLHDRPFSHTLNEINGSNCLSIGGSKQHRA
jgi:hypothetical protein